MKNYSQIKDRELHRIVPTAIIYKDNKYLITQRSLNKKVYPGKWHVPGGGLSIDDYISNKPNNDGAWYFALEDTLRREILEEVNLKVGKLDYLLDLCFIRPDNIPVITLSFYAPYKSGKVKLDRESIDFAWITVKDLKKYDIIAGIPEEIRMVDDKINGRKFKNYFK